jgi:hypothetical protein
VGKRFHDNVPFRSKGGPSCGVFGRKARGLVAGRGEEAIPNFESASIRILKNHGEFNYTLIFLEKIGYGVDSPWAGMAASF